MNTKNKRRLILSSLSKFVWELRDFKKIFAFILDKVLFSESHRLNTALELKRAFSFLRPPKASTLG